MNHRFMIGRSPRNSCYYEIDIRRMERRHANDMQHFKCWSFALGATCGQTQLLVIPWAFSVRPNCVAGNVHPLRTSQTGTYRWEFRLMSANRSDYTPKSNMEFQVQGELDLRQKNATRVWRVGCQIRDCLPLRHHLLT